MGECGVPAVCLTHGLAPGFGIVTDLAEEEVVDLDCLRLGAVADGARHRVVGSKKSEARIEQVRRKSLGSETTFARDLMAWDEAPPVLAPLFESIWAGCVKGGLTARTVTVKVKYADFQQITRGRSVVDGITLCGLHELLSEFP